MSGDMFSHLSEDGKPLDSNLQTATIGRVNINKIIGNSCSYSGICRKDRTLNLGICVHCKYHILHDIPKLIDRELDKYGS